MRISDVRVLTDGEQLRAAGRAGAHRLSLVGALGDPPIADGALAKVLFRLLLRMLVHVFSSPESARGRRPTARGLRVGTRRASVPPRYCPCAHSARADRGAPRHRG